jgi:transcriptional repressor NrdR
VKCPFCKKQKTRVLDSRTSNNGTVIRRRRSCRRCRRRFTTYERPEQKLLWVVKRDGRKEMFDRLKIRAGILAACNKRPVSERKIRDIVAKIEREIMRSYATEISSKVIGEMVLNELKRADKVAYMRFASVYRSFEDVDQFIQEARTFRKK